MTGVSSVSVALDVRQTGTLVQAPHQAPFEALPADPEAGHVARYQMTGYSIDRVGPGDHHLCLAGGPG